MVKDREGQDMTCKGGWKDPKNASPFSTALSTVHVNAHGRTGDYKDCCEGCSVAFRTGNTGGCEFHNGDPRTTRSGNVCRSTLVKNTIEHIVKNSDHQIVGAKHLLPSQVRQIRDHCIGSNDKGKFEIFSLLLMSISLFLRKMEYTSLEAANFNMEMFVMKDSYCIEALNLKVRGKSKRTKERGALFM